MRRPSLFLAVFLLLSAGVPGPAHAGPRALPLVSPTPQKIERIGPDIPLPGRVELITTDATDPAAADLLRTLLDQQGIAVTAHAPLTVRLGPADRPDIARRLAGTTIPSTAEGYALRAEKHQVTLGGVDPAGQYYAVQTLRQLFRPGRTLAGVAVSDHPAMALRGAIEGFYGSPWTHAERLDQLAFYGTIKTNSYVYAPKDDPYHRDRWREPYPAGKLAELRELVDAATSHHVRFTFAVSPGTTICYSSTADRAALTGKLQAMYDIGVRDFSIPLDDISYTRWNCTADQDTYGAPGAGAAARAQVDLLNDVQQNFVASHPGVRPLQMVPTEYGDLTDTAYKQEIRSTLDPKVLVMWTGTDVVPPSITVDQASRASALFGRDVFVWDNYPVNDYAQSAGRLLLAPYDKREPGLAGHVAGIVANPMNQAAASKVVLFTMADFSWNDRAYDRDISWRQVATVLAGGDASGVPALLTFFDLNHLAPTFGSDPWQPQAPALAARLATFWAAYPDPAARRTLAGYVRQIAEAPAVIRSTVTDAAFLDDTAHWLDATALWGRAADRGLAVLSAIEAGDAPAAAAARTEMNALEQQARRIRSVPGENRIEGAVQIGDGVLDTFLDRVRAAHDTFLGLPPLQNLSQGKAATQISDYSADYPAAASVNGNVFDFSTTSGAEAQPWWQVDLGTASDIETVAVHNRVDCCAERVRDYHVLVSADPFPPTLAEALAAPGVAGVHETEQAGRPTTITIPARGRYVRVWLATPAPQELNLAEVQVFGRPA
ncbi:beta-N-acetylglucosaminidase domain-containing protein [Actinoplanes sp. NBRC 101535]|uniref:beta-N-acetylglucosaminidase domain-containing protein n=1 Tax=Actinoplanes sp. NBRC 101535 TaxID=3032196 RepID=UPI0024A093DD|nr:beta-N-acetylglucosaminidase domain-containing protein [Actinoplanes sp. NBRC 101535]GLY02970.1 beta-N-acetylglucosaminidase [Actinoplanes sp. NBRC 101535]